MFIISIILLFFFAVTVYSLVRLNKYEVCYVKSNIDGKEYLVRELPDKQDAADILATVRRNLISLADYMDKNKDKWPNEKGYIEALKNKIDTVVINESTEDNEYTSYSVNKGEQIVFCLRSKNTSKLHDINTIMYVAIHEVSHIACPEFGHTELFKKIFAFFATIAVGLNIYKKQDFHNNPAEYCGLIITESII